MPRKKADCPDCGQYRQIDGRGLCGTCYRKVREAEDPGLRAARLERDRERCRRYYEAHSEEVRARMKRNYALGISGRHRKPRVVKLKPALPVGEDVVVTGHSEMSFTVASVCQACNNRWADHGLCRLKLEHMRRMG